jgi:hypothetical protein
MKGYTTHALKLNLNTLSKLATIDATKVEIVNQSIEHSWKSFYELKIQPKKEVVPEWYGKEEKVEESKEDKLEKLRVVYQVYKTSSRFEDAKRIQEEYFELTGKDIETEI